MTEASTEVLKFDRQEAIDNIKRALGDGVVSLELTDAQWADALDAALRTFSKHIPKERFHSIQVSPEVKHYALPEDKVGEGLIECIPPIPATSLNITIGGEVTLGTILHTLSLGELYLINMYWDTVRDILGAPFDWEYRHDTRDLFVTGVQANGTLVYKYMETWKAEDLPQRHWDWVFDFGVAVAKGTLGQIRRKLGSIPGPTGEVDLNGDAMVQEASDSQRDLVEQLREKIGDRYLVPTLAPTFF